MGNAIYLSGRKEASVSGTGEGREMGRHFLIQDGVRDATLSFLLTRGYNAELYSPFVTYMRCA